jgi:Ca-activated chloride channel homolog
MKIQTTLDHGAPPFPGGPLPVRMLLDVTGSAVDKKDAVPLNLALVLDRSGSMNGAPMHSAIEAAKLVARRMGATNRLSVVTYDSEVEVLARGATGTGLSAVVHGLDQVFPRGMTNLSGGWLAGRECVEDHMMEGGVNRVILLTDGHANEGITDPNKLGGLFEMASAQGITTTTVGFGEGFDEDLLEKLADAGRGSAYYIETVEQAPGVFEQELEDLLGLAAQNVTVKIELGADTMIAAVRHAYPSTETETGVELTLGDLYAEEPKLLLVELVPSSATPGAELRLATVTVRGHVLTAEGGVEIREVHLPITIAVGADPRVEPEIEKVHVLLDAARARQEAMDRADRGDYGGAAHVLRESARNFRHSSVADAEVMREANELASMAVTLDDRAYGSTDRKYMKQMTYDAKRGRRKASERIRRSGGTDTYGYGEEE